MLIRGVGANVFQPPAPHPRPPPNIPRLPTIGCHGGRDWVANPGTLHGVQRQALLVRPDGPPVLLHQLERLGLPRVPCARGGGGQGGGEGNAAQHFSAAK